MGRSRADAMTRAAEVAGRGGDAWSGKGGRRCLRKWAAAWDGREADEWRRVMAAATTAKLKVAGGGSVVRPAQAQPRGGGHSTSRPPPEGTGERVRSARAGVPPPDGRGIERSTGGRQAPNARALVQSLAACGCPPGDASARGGVSLPTGASWRSTRCARGRDHQCQR